MADTPGFVLKVKGTPSYEDWRSVLQFMKEIVRENPEGDFFKNVESKDTSLYCTSFKSAYTADALRGRMKTP